MSVEINADKRLTVRDVMSAAVARVLELQQVDLQRTFFELGGSSLAAVMLSEQLEDLIGIPVPIESLLQDPILSDFADALQSQIEGAGI